MPEWKQVRGYEGLYEVSDEGQVRRVGSATGAQVGKVLKVLRYQNKRRFVVLCRESRPRSISLPNIVAEAFFGPRPDGHEIDHKDGNIDNNCADNLEYVTLGENRIRSVRLGRKPRLLSDADVQDVLKLHADGATFLEIGQKFGVSGVLVSKICKGLLYTTKVNPGIYPDRARARATQQKLKTAKPRLLTSDQEQEVRRLYREEGWSQAKVAEWYGVSQALVSNILKRTP